MIIPNSHGKIKVMFQTTNQQYVSKLLYEILPCFPVETSVALLRGRKQQAQNGSRSHDQREDSRSKPGEKLDVKVGGHPGHETIG